MKNRILILAMALTFASIASQLYAVKPSKADAEREADNRRRAAEDAAKRPPQVDPKVVIIKPSQETFEEPLMNPSQFRTYIISKEDTKQQYSEEGELIHLELEKARTILDPQKGLVAIYSVALDYKNCLPLEKSAGSRAVDGVTITVKGKRSARSKTDKNPGKAEDEAHPIFYKNGQMPEKLKDPPFWQRHFINPIHLEFRTRNTPQGLHPLFRSPSGDVSDVLPDHRAVRAVDIKQDAPTTATCLVVAAKLTPEQVAAGVESLRLVLSIRIRDHAATHLESFKPQSPDNPGDNCWTYVPCQLEAIRLLDANKAEIAIIHIKS